MIKNPVSNIQPTIHISMANVTINFNALIMFVLLLQYKYNTFISNFQIFLENNYYFFKYHNLGIDNCYT